MIDENKLTKNQKFTFNKIKGGSILGIISLILFLFIFIIKGKMKFYYPIPIILIFFIIILIYIFIYAKNHTHELIEKEVSENIWKERKFEEAFLAVLGLFILIGFFVFRLNNFSEKEIRIMAYKLSPLLFSIFGLYAIYNKYLPFYKNGIKIFEWEGKNAIIVGKILFWSGIILTILIFWVLSL